VRNMCQALVGIRLHLGSHYRDQVETSFRESWGTTEDHTATHDNHKNDRRQQAGPQEVGKAS
jgi:hypothetical protein